MLSRTLRRALVEHKAQLPPTFLLPWAARLSTTSQIDPSAASLPPQGLSSANLHGQVTSTSRAGEGAQAIRQVTQDLATPNDTTSSSVSSSVRELLPLLRAQGPHYITIHIHGFPYLVTQGDTVRLPFFMHGVQPGDVLRLNRAINLGSRDFTLKAPTPDSRAKQTEFQATAEARTSTSALTPDAPDSSSARLAVAPHYIPHIAKGKHAYLDERLFVCRAVVMAVETEPLRMKEKTKRRQRHVRTIKSKHQYTILKIKELTVNGVEALDGPSL